MTVAELIERLRQCPWQDALVVIPGYEDGYKEVAGWRFIRLSLNANKEWYLGPHAEAEDGDGTPAYLITSARSS